MNTKNDGGAAFPAPAFPGYDAPPLGAYRGMSLRDYFAGQALAGIMADATLGSNAIRIAEGCYQIADAMLAESEKP